MVMKLRPKQWLPVLVVIVSFVFVGALSLQAVSNADNWFHLKVGELLLKTRVFPHQDVMSHTAYGRQLTAPSWLYSVAAQSLAARWGLNSISFLRMFCALAAMILAIKTGRLLGSPAFVTAPIFALAFWAISIAWMDRPHIFGYLFISFTVYALVAYSQKPTRLIWWIPLVTIPWANTHASVPFVMVLIGLFMAATWVDTYFFRRETAATSRRIDYRELLIIFGLCFGASLINPYGLKMYEYFFKITPTAKGNIFEWLPLSNFFDDTYVQSFSVLLISTLAALLFTAIFWRKQISLWEVGLTGILTWMSLSALRHIVIFALVLSPYLAKNVFFLVKRATSYFPLPPLSPPSLIYQLGALVTICWLSLNPLRAIWHGNWGVSFAMLPLGATDFLDKIELKGKMYNHFNWGGYLIWKYFPKYLTFIDGRLDMFVPDIYKDWIIPASGDEDWEKVFAKYQVDWVIFPSPGIWQGLKDKTGPGKEWALVYWDDVASIFLRRGKGNDEIISQFEYTAITPFDPNIPAVPEKSAQAIKEYQRVIQEAPGFCLTAYNKLGVIYLLNEEWELAKSAFQQALQLNPLYASVSFNLGVIYEREKNYPEAVKYYQQTVKSDPKFTTAYKNLGKVYAYQLGDYKSGAKYLRQYAELTSDIEEKYFTSLEVKNLERGIETLNKSLDN